MEWIWIQHRVAVRLDDELDWQIMLLDDHRCVVEPRRGFALLSILVDVQYGDIGDIGMHWPFRGIGWQSRMRELTALI